ncbi:MAG TPA: glycosyltransferase family 39 protein [Rhizomicrobium sp.]|jgi:hypothetical protein
MSLADAGRERRMNAFDHAIAPVLPVLLVVTALGCVAGVLRALDIAPLHVPLDPDEGWNAYHAVAAMAGHSPYPAHTDFMVNNYPPLSFYIVGIIGLLTGDPIVAGRIVSLVSFVCACICVALAVRQMKGGLQGAIFAAVLFAAILLLTSDYVGMDDPQLLGHALQLAALLFLLPAAGTSRAVPAAAVLFVAGGYVKHDLFVLPLASIAWLATYDRRSAFRLAIWCLALSLCGLALFRLIFGVDLLGELASARLWSLFQFVENFNTWLPFVAVPILGFAGLALWHQKDPAVALVVIYASVAICVGAFLAGGAGVDVNVMFDADIALAMSAGLALGRMLEQRGPVPHVVGRVFALAGLIPFAVVALQNTEWRDGDFWLHPMRDETALATQDIAFLQARKGPAICETLAYCYWAGKPASVDVFNLDQQLRTGRRNPSPFVSLLEAHHFSAIELDETEPFPLPPLVRSAILFNYRLDHTNDDGAFLIPR